MTATSSENERRLREYIEAWNDHDPDAIVECLSTDCEQLTRPELREIAESWFAAFPDLTHDIEELAVDEDWVLARFTLRGTHQESYQGVPPTGTEIEVADHASVRFENGRIVELHATADTTALLEQLGVRMPPGGTSATNEALVRQYFEALNDRDREAFVATLAEDFTYGDIEGPEEMADSDWQWLEAMDLTWHIQELHASEEFVTTRLRVTGTHVREILGLEPTGESFEITALTVSRVENGEIVEWWGSGISPVCSIRLGRSTRQPTRGNRGRWTQALSSAWHSYQLLTLATAPLGGIGAAMGHTVGHGDGSNASVRERVGPT